MNDKEYTYDIDKYTIGVDTNGEDGIGMTIAIIKNGEINFLGNCYGENARCIDLLIKENRELKKQTRETEKCLKDMYHINIENDKELDKLKNQLEDYKKLGFKHLVDKNNNLETQQKELKKQLEDKEDYINKLQATKDKLDKWDYENTMQQKEFIKYLEDEIKTLEKDILETIDDMDIYMKQVKSLIIEEILQKYKSIIGVSDENNIK